MAKKAAKPAAKKETKKVAKDKAPKKAEKVVAAPSVEVAAKPPKEPKAPKPPKPPKISAKVKKATEAAATAAAEANKKWTELKEKHGAEKASNYVMSATFPALSPLQHKVLGWGYVLSNNNDRLEVLFEMGTKILISNYQSK